MSIETNISGWDPGLETGPVFLEYQSSFGNTVRLPVRSLEKVRYAGPPFGAEKVYLKVPVPMEADPEHVMTLVVQLHEIPEKMKVLYLRNPDLLGAGDELTCIVGRAPRLVPRRAS